MRRLATAAALIALLPAVSAAQDWGRPEFSAPRSADARADGATRVDVQARAGTLRVEGRAGLREVRAHGTARASSRAILDDVRLVVERRGGTVHVEVLTPDDLRDGYAGLDLVVEVPQDLDADVHDGSGDLEVRDVGRLSLTDGSGDVVVRSVGALRLADGSGEVRATDVRGDAVVEDGSGELTLRDVRGTVTVRDGSGALDAQGVGGDVVIQRKGSGSISVARVRGDLVVDRGVRRDVRYSDVEGRVSVPERRDGRDRWR